MAQAGKNKGLVILDPRAELREPFPRRHQDEYIDALRKELAMTENMVKPEQYTQTNDAGKQKLIKRQATKLPDGA